MELSLTAWGVIGVLAGAAVLSMLYTLACVVRTDRGVHDLHVQVNTLRIDYIERMQERLEQAHEDQLLGRTTED